MALALSQKAKKALQTSLGKGVGDEVIPVLQRRATTLAAIGSTTNLVAPGSLAAAAPLAGTETRLDGLEAKVDALIAALKAANLMA